MNLQELKSTRKGQKRLHRKLDLGRVTIAKHKEKHDRLDAERLQAVNEMKSLENNNS